MAVLKSRKLHFTYHSRDKMRFYGLSEARVRRVLHAPRRVEEGIAPKTIAMMQPTALKSSGRTAKWSQEVWVMVQDLPATRKIISAWRYPGVTKPRSEFTREFLAKEYLEFLTKDK